MSNTNDASSVIILEIHLANQDPEENLQFIRLPTNIILELDVLIEDVAQIEGGPLECKMDLLVWPAYPEDEHGNIGRITAPQMKMLGLKEGDLVKLRVSPFQAAAKQRMEHLLHHNINVPPLTNEDLAVCEEKEAPLELKNDAGLKDSPNYGAKTEESAATIDRGEGSEGGLIAIPGEDGSILLVGCEQNPENEEMQDEIPIKQPIKNESLTIDEDDIEIDTDIASEIDRKVAGFKKRKQG